MPKSDLPPVKFDPFIIAEIEATGIVEADEIFAEISEKPLKKQPNIAVRILNTFSFIPFVNK